LGVVAFWIVLLLGYPCIMLRCVVIRCSLVWRVFYVVCICVYLVGCIIIVDISVADCQVDLSGLVISDFVIDVVGVAAVL
jgi:hypothetical protein